MVNGTCLKHNFLPLEGEGKADEEKCPVNISPAERVHKDVHPGLQVKQGLRNEEEGGGEISNMAETQPPSKPSPCRGEGVISYKE